MTNTYAVCMRRVDLASLAALRTSPDVQVREDEAHLWVHFTALDDALQTTTRSLPGIRYLVHADGQLTKHGDRVPNGHLPQGTWTPLADWMAIHLPEPRWTAHPQAAIPIRLTRGGQPSEANILTTDLQTWYDFAVTAPAVRLDRLAFAQNDDREVLIRGTPLPPLTGKRFVEQDGIAVPTGWTFSPAIASAVVRAVMGLDDNDVAIFHSDGSWEQIHGHDLVRASRAAVRASADHA